MSVWYLRLWNTSWRGQTDRGQVSLTTSANVGLLGGFISLLRVDQPIEEFKRVELLAWQEL